MNKFKAGDSIAKNNDPTTTGVIVTSDFSTYTIRWDSHGKTYRHTYWMIDDSYYDRRKYREDRIDQLV